ncbi:MAG: hypothetical protein K0R84_2081 [Clostridia bacterium]|nr:hypothetical protein [Clostridia bacterium]
MKKKGFIAIALVICLALVFSGCGKKAENTAEIPASGEVLPPVHAEIIEGPSEPQLPLCPLTGLPVEQEKLELRPFAVMIDNYPSARPQSGLMNAEIVYEMPAEGGITRYMAIYHHQDAEKIGPVRSARSYFIDAAMEYNAAYLHCGGSPEALQDIKTLRVDSLNELNGESNYWRARDRKAPHNLYTSTKLTREVLKAKKLDNEKWSYSMNISTEFVNLEGKTINEFVIDYKQNYKAGYQYDKGKKIFFRTINGVRLKDKETGTEISTVNIIVEKVGSKVVDDAGRLDLDNIGSGKGWFLTGGKMIEIEWSKESREAKTIYKDLKGNPIKLNAGNTWIQVIPDYATLEFKE